MAKAMFVLEDDDEAKVVVLRPFLYKVSDGKVVVRVKDENDVTWTLVELNVVYGVRRCSGLPERLGLPVEDDGRLLEFE